jgi:hypothetical protein
MSLKENLFATSLLLACLSSPAQDIEISLTFDSPIIDRTSLSDHRYLAVIAAENGFLLSQIKNVSALFSIKLKSTSMYIDQTSYGYSKYYKLRTTVGASRKLGDKCSFSTGFGLTQENIPEALIHYRRAVADAQFSFALTRKDKINLLARNITRIDRSIRPDKLIVLFDHKIFTESSIKVALIKPLIDPVYMRSEISYKLKNVILYSGIRSRPLSFQLGFSWIRNNLSIFLGTFYTHTLGTSPSTCFVWNGD